MDFRYLAVDGPIGLGKTTLARHLGARLDASVILDDARNPFLDDFYADRAGAAFQAQLFFTLARHRQLLTLRQRELFSQTTVCDYLFERDRVYAFLTLDDNELFIYQRLFDLVARELTAPDMVIYLQAPTETIRKRLQERDRQADAAGLVDDRIAGPSDAYVAELNDAYNHFFFHYTATPLLVVETSDVDPAWGDEAVTDLLRQIKGMTGGTRYYVPRTR